MFAPWQSIPYNNRVSIASPSLSLRLHDLWGVGSERKTQLEKLELKTVEDLLLHRPRRYEDRRHTRQIRDLELGEATTVRGQIVALGIKRFRKGIKSIFEFIIDDGTARLHCRWWNMPYMERYFNQGDEVFVYGKPNSIKPRLIDHPETEVIEPGEDSSIHINRIVPIYPLTEGLSQRWLRGFAWRALAQFGEKIEEPWPRDLLPGWLARAEAVRLLHFPEQIDQAEKARKRLALDELISLQLEIQRRRKTLQDSSSALPCGGDNRFIKPFLEQLGFRLTAAQTRVLREIRQDLSGAFPMRRLLQGDVGSGKTAVAAASALMVIESGFAVTLMAPTEILAEQHFQTFSRWFQPLGIPVEIQTGSRKTSKDSDRALLANQPDLLGKPVPALGLPPLFIGTHALVESAFEVEKLGLVIIDEQHKFGVSQREKLVRKGRYPHVLVMTATPIPRTLGLTLYGDLDISVIDELPKQRGVIKTFLRTSDKLPKVWEFIRQKLAEGRQAYVVYPRVEEGGTGNLKAVTKEYERLQQLMAPHKVGLLHGRLKPGEKEATMTLFRQNQIQVLLATSIIEVGVDVPNSTIMLIENAEQFGLAQLHQLRGRIGRGAHDSYCILVAEVKTPEAQQRLKVLEDTTDGFRIAEEDLQLRGPGELLGTEQSGLPPFRFADLRRDLGLIELARNTARKLSAAKAG
ncbi:MAG: ATP-dependent helicase RecG [Verrucomicrobiales bacterium]|nr:ATP-dependent helicase RecG [Verrucomicrobiales bacterium]